MHSWCIQFDCDNLLSSWYCTHIISLCIWYLSWCVGKMFKIDVATIHLIWIHESKLTFFLFTPVIFPTHFHYVIEDWTSLQNKTNLWGGCKSAPESLVVDLLSKGKLYRLYHLHYLSPLTKNISKCNLLIFIYFFTFSILCQFVPVCCSTAAWATLRLDKRLALLTWGHLYR